MTTRIPESVSIWLLDWSILAAMGKTMPPRDPNDDDDEVEDEDEDEDEDESGDAEDNEPAVVREPDE